MSKRLLLLFVTLSLAFNVILLFASGFNAQWTLHRVSGGQFTTLPVSLRFMNLVVGAFSAYLILFAYNLYAKAGAWSPRTLLISRAVSLVFILSALTNVISRSPEERWNAFPAAIIAIGIFKLSKQES